jgi:hypothetical protein
VEAVVDAAGAGKWEDEGNDGSIDIKNQFNQNLCPPPSLSCSLPC